MNDVTLKVYKPDYSFIFKNYLDPDIWDKKYTIYSYKNDSWKIFLEGINTREKTLSFRISCNNAPWYDELLISYKLNHPEYTLKVFENAVNSTLRKMIRDYYSKANYRPTYQLESDFYNKRYKELEAMYKDAVKSIYYDLPEIIQSNFYISDILDKVIENKIGDSPKSTPDDPEVWAHKELQIFDGINEVIQKQPPGDYISEKDIKEMEELIEDYWATEDAEINEILKSRFNLDLEYDHDLIESVLEDK